MRIRSSCSVATLLLVLVLAVSGCGERTDVSTIDPTTPAPTSSTTTPPSEGLEKIRVVGQVIEDGDCVVVRDDNQITWTITGGPADELVLHDRVQVTGAPDLAAEGCGGPVVVATSVKVLPPVE